VNSWRQKQKACGWGQVLRSGNKIQVLLAITDSPPDVRIMLTELLWEKRCPKLREQAKHHSQRREYLGAGWYGCTQTIRSILESAWNRDWNILSMGISVHLWSMVFIHLQSAKSQWLQEGLVQMGPSRS
jgi:hypothetical protein